MDKHKIRFGTIAVDKGYITKDQLFQALTIQAKENIEEAKHRFIGQILVGEGFLSEKQVDEVLKALNNQAIYMLTGGR